MLLSFPFTPHFDGVRSQWGITVSFEFHGFAFYFMLYFITRFLLLQAMPSASFARSESLLLFSAHIHTHTHRLLLAALLPWHSLICWQRQLLALAKLKAAWQDRHRFARWRGWTALAFVSDSFCWLFINCQPAMHSRSSLTELYAPHWCELLLCLTWFLWRLLLWNTFLVLKLDY